MYAGPARFARPEAKRRRNGLGFRHVAKSQIASRRAREWARAAARRRSRVRSPCARTPGRRRVRRCAVGRPTAVDCRWAGADRIDGITPRRRRRFEAQEACSIMNTERPPRPAAGRPPDRPPAARPCFAREAAEQLRQPHLELAAGSRRWRRSGRRRVALAVSADRPSAQRSAVSCGQTSRCGAHGLNRSLAEGKRPHPPAARSPAPAAARATSCAHRCRQRQAA